MDLKIFLTVFTTIFIAEIGDKTQLATILYASGAEYSKIAVFIGAAAALILASGIGVLIGATVSHLLHPRYMSWIAGVAFILVGIWTIVRA